MKRPLTLVNIGLLVIIVVVLALRSNYAVDWLNSYKPKTTFEKTVLNKINKDELSSLYFYQGDNTDNPIIITGRSKINEILNVLLPIELKEKRNTPSSSEFHINIELNGKITFFTGFSSNKSELYMNDLSDVKKPTNKTYNIIKNYDRDKLKALFEL